MAVFLGKVAAVSALVPLFSVIIPTYNRSEQLRQALESISAQSCRDFEVIVCDDGSTDNTRLIVESFLSVMSVTYLWDDNFGGPARPRNNGIAVARGEWLCFLDSDDWWYPAKLDAIDAHLANADVIYHDLDIHPRSVWPITGRFRSRNLHPPAFVDLMLKGNALPNSSVVVRRDVIVAAGGFSEDKSLIAAEDYDLWLRLARQNRRFVRIPRSLGAYRLGGGNISHPSLTQAERVEAIFQRHAPFLSEEARAQSRLQFNLMEARIKHKIGLRDEALALLRPILAAGDPVLKFQASILMAYIRWSSLLGR